jgi:hypothetical protein
MKEEEKKVNTLSPRQVHFILQGKGGVGKSFVASLLMQHLMQRPFGAIAVDTDPVNATLSGYRAFDVQRLELMQDGVIQERAFDDLIEEILEKDRSFVIDNGAASFVPLSAYLSENDAIEAIIESGKEVFIHTIITGGQALLDTLNGFASLASQMPEEVKIIVWLNEYFGEIYAEDKDFLQMQVYLKYQDRVKGIVTLPSRTKATYGEDLCRLLDKKMTFAEGRSSGEFTCMAKSRLRKMADHIFSQLDHVI